MYIHMCTYIGMHLPYMRPIIIPCMHRYSYISMNTYNGIFSSIMVRISKYIHCYINDCYNYLHIPAHTCAYSVRPCIINVRMQKGMYHNSV